MKRFVFLTLMVTVCIHPSFSKTIYVNPVCGDDNWTGASADCQAPEPTGPKATLLNALQNANSNDVIIAADGIYSEGNMDIPPFVSLQSQNGPSGCIIDCSQFESAFFMRENSQLEGFTLTNSLNSAVQINGAWGVCMQDCVFVNCASSVGGAVYMMGASVQIRQCTFFNNHTNGPGGAILAAQNSSLTVDLCTFENNTSGYRGGAIRVFQGTATILDSDFESNQAQDSGGAVQAEDATLFMSYCRFNNNSSEWFGGALGCLMENNMIASNCAFSGNYSASEGGAVISSEGSSSAFNDCVFSDNIANNEGGAVFSSGSLVMDQCLVQSNRSHNQSGGALSIQHDAYLTDCRLIGNTSYAFGTVHIKAESHVHLDRCLLVGNRTIESQTGTLHAGYSTLSMTNVTIADNAPVGVPSVFLTGMFTPTPIKNCILWNDAETQVFTANDLPPAISYTNVHTNTILLPPGTGNLSTDPAFVMHGHFENTGNVSEESDDTWVEGDYHLQSQAGHWDRASQSWLYDAQTSPCIDRGDPLDDVREEPFPNGQRRNLGAYGGGEHASKSPVCGGPIPGDTNNDCKVDFQDFAAVAAHWLECNMIPQSLCW